MIVSSITAVLLVGSAAALASTQLNSLTEVSTAFDGMGSTGLEWSGATYNAESHVLVTIDDETNAYEFALTKDGEIDEDVDPRLIELDLGRSDFEGIAWISGEKYGFLSEGDGEVVIATIPAPAPSGITTISTDDIERSFDVISGSWGNLGPEGLATDGKAFYVTREMPATLAKFDFDGDFIGSVSLSDQLGDASGVAVLTDGTYLVISHESRVVAHYEVDWTTETATHLGSRDADLFTQLEGIAVVGDTDVHLFGELKNGGQTYSRLHGQLVPVVYAVSDVNCSGAVTLSDALLIAQMRAGLIDAQPGCGSGDHNGDGIVTLSDAIMIAQCQVGVSNVGCPNVAWNPGA